MFILIPVGIAAIWGYRDHKRRELALLGAPVATAPITVDVVDNTAQPITPAQKNGFAYDLPTAVAKPPKENPTDVPATISAANPSIAVGTKDLLGDTFVVAASAGGRTAMTQEEREAANAATLEAKFWGES